MRHKFLDGWSDVDHCLFLLSCRAFIQGAIAGDEIGVGFLCGAFIFEAGKAFLLFNPVQSGDVEIKIIHLAVELCDPFLDAVLGGADIILLHGQVPRDLI